MPPFMSVSDEAGHWISFVGPLEFDKSRLLIHRLSPYLYLNLIWQTFEYGEGTSGLSRLIWIEHRN